MSTSTATPGRRRRTASTSAGRWIAKPPATTTGPAIPSRSSTVAASAASAAGRGVEDALGRRVAALGELGHDSGAPGPVPLVPGRVDVVDEQCAVGEPAVGHQCGRQHVDGFAAVHRVQRVPHGVERDLVAAALVAEDVAPAAGAGVAPVRSGSPGHRAGAADQGDAGDAVGGGQDQARVVDDLDPRAPDVRGDHVAHDAFRDGGVGAGCAGAHGHHPVRPDGGEHLAEAGGGGLPADRRDVGTARLGLGDDDTVERADGAGGGSTDVEPDHPSHRTSGLDVWSNSSRSLRIRQDGCGRLVAVSDPDVTCVRCAAERDPRDPAATGLGQRTRRRAHHLDVPRLCPTPRPRHRGQAHPGMVAVART